MPEPAKHQRLAALSSLNTDEFRDPDACYSREQIARVEDCIGSSVLLRACDCDDFLVKISELELYRGPQGFVSLGRLAGTVTWGAVRWERVDIDRRAMAKKKGWARIDSLDDILVGVPDSHYQFRMKSMRLRTLRANGHELLTVTSVDGHDLIDGTRCHWEIDIDDPVLCAMSWHWECVNWLCSKRCRVQADGSTLGDCMCPGTGFCGWMNQPLCVTVNCARRCRLSGYFVLGCECDAGAATA